MESSEKSAALELIRDYKGDSIAPEILERRLGIARWDAIALLKEFDDSGYGRFVLGRKGHSTRFEKGTLPDGQGAPAGSPVTIPNSEAEQVFRLPRNPPVYIRVPADITSTEAVRISKWLDAIALGAD